MLLERNTKERELKELLAATPKDIWIRDLDALELFFNEQEASKAEHAMNEVKKTKPKKKTKNLVDTDSDEYQEKVKKPTKKTIKDPGPKDKPASKKAAPKKQAVVLDDEDDVFSRIDRMLGKPSRERSPTSDGLL